MEFRKEIAKQEGKSLFTRTFTAKFHFCEATHTEQQQLARCSLTALNQTIYSIVMERQMTKKSYNMEKLFLLLFRSTCDIKTKAAHNNAKKEMTETLSAMPFFNWTDRYACKFVAYCFHVALLCFLCYCPDNVASLLECALDEIKVVESLDRAKTKTIFLFLYKLAPPAIFCWKLEQTFLNEKTYFVQQQTVVLTLIEL